MEQEISRWNGFGRALRKEDREVFEELMGMCRSLASESNGVINRAIFESMVMSILVAQERKLQSLHYKLHEVLWQKVCARERAPTSSRPAALGSFREV